MVVRMTVDGFPMNYGKYGKNRVKCEFIVFFGNFLLFGTDRLEFDQFFL